MYEAAGSEPLITLHADHYLFDDFNDDLENSIHNDNWEDTLRKDSLEYWKLAPTNNLEAALVTFLRAGAYTAHSSSDGSGIEIVEVYVAHTCYYPREVRPLHWAHSVLHSLFKFPLEYESVDLGIVPDIHRKRLFEKHLLYLARR